MKKQWIGLLVITLLVLGLLMGCSGTPEPTQPPETETPTTEAPTTQPPETEAPTTEEPTTEAPTTEEPTQSQEELEREWFYHVFWELDPETTDAWLKDHPELAPHPAAPQAKGTKAAPRDAEPQLPPGIVSRGLELGLSLKDLAYLLQRPLEEIEREAGKKG